MVEKAHVIKLLMRLAEHLSAQLPTPTGRAYVTAVARSKLKVWPCVSSRTLLKRKRKR